MNLLRILDLLFTYLCIVLLPIDCCINLLNGAWKPVSLEERTVKADLVITANILSTAPIFRSTRFYEATFEVINVLKGWELLKKLHRQNITAVQMLEPKIIVSAIGFGDSRECFSSVEIGESYALFLGWNVATKQIVARYDDIFGAADKLFKRTERDILITLGWEEWSSWSRCSKECGHGTQTRQRECRKTPKNPECHGPKEQTRQCNTFSCKGTYDVLKFILDQRKDPFSAWQPHDLNVYKNSINQPSPAKAPTYLLIEAFPKESVVHMSFRGPVKNTQFLHSVYDANNRMELGIEVSRYTFAFSYDKKIDMGTKSRQTISYTYTFSDDIWYTVAILLTKNEVAFRINCEEEHRATINDEILQNFDVYGQMFLGADKEEESEKSFVRVEMGSILVSSDPKSFTQQCGMLLVDTDPFAGVGENDGSGMPGILSGPDDSESGDVDEEDGSGENVSTPRRKPLVLVCKCKNRGVCKENNTCTCPRGWTGQFCATATCMNKCLNGGKCTAPNKCECKTLTSGSYCQFRECALPCKNNGECIGMNKCKCKQGFEGPQCQYESCSKRCLNGGSCVPDGSCVCKKGFKGERCQFPESCKRFVTKLVKYVKPATKIFFINEEVPCADNKSKKCIKRRSKSQTYETTDYRQVYICKT